ncbi:hypothetical protein AVEN_272385-1 [Araneus ventricosus]|uniref:DDE-1 domain-containing protein n=1 Tax=Araneus ventricosus TaxID=182803 RepID=A0A4Y2I1K5_ARAVE|nr:hypothetical protein AVEN_272385-1 [Araneus ventricosus]
MLQLAEQNAIILLCLPPHTSHWLQPLDRSFFNSLKTNYYAACDNFLKNHPSRKINRLQFGNLLNSAWVKSAHVEIGIEGFQACGIIPFDLDVIPHYAHLSEVEI